MNIGILEYDGNIRNQLMEVISNECPKANVISPATADFSVGTTEFLSNS